MVTIQLHLRLQADSHRELSTIAQACRLQPSALGVILLEAGHTEAVLFKNYRELVTPAAALEFWGIVPE